MISERKEGCVVGARASGQLTQNVRLWIGCPEGFMETGIFKLGFKEWVGVFQMKKGMVGRMKF